MESTHDGTRATSRPRVTARPSSHSMRSASRTFPNSRVRVRRPTLAGRRPKVIFYHRAFGITLTEYGMELTTRYGGPLDVGRSRRAVVAKARNGQAVTGGFESAARCNSADIVSIDFERQRGRPLP